jgi:hypothetical protein
MRITSRSGRRLVLAAMLLAVPSAAAAQVFVGATRPRPGSVEMAVGGVWNLGTDFGSADATLTPNPSGGQTSFDLFSTETKLGGAPGALFLVGVYVTRSIAVEGGVQYARPTLEVRLTDDFENAPDVTATTSISQYLFTGSLVYHFARPGAKTAPFVAGGAGHVRDVHAGNGLVETGLEYHGKAGVKLWFGRRQNNGLRIEGGISFRDGGFTLDDDHRVVPSASASYAYRF